MGRFQGEKAVSLPLTAVTDLRNKVYAATGRKIRQVSIDPTVSIERDEAIGRDALSATERARKALSALDSFNRRFAELTN